MKPSSSQNSILSDLDIQIIILVGWCIYYHHHQSRTLWDDVVLELVAAVLKKKFGNAYNKNVPSGYSTSWMRCFLKNLWFCSGCCSRSLLYIDSKNLQIESTQLYMHHLLRWVVNDSLYKLSEEDYLHQQQHWTKQLTTIIYTWLVIVSDDFQTTPSLFLFYLFAWHVRVV